MHKNILLPVLALVAAPTLAIGPKQVDGYGAIKLGMSFDNVLKALPDVQWNELLLKACQNDLPVTGCLLSQDEGFLDRIDGMPFQAHLSINKHDVLTDITLRYERENSEMSQTLCLSLFDRALDHVAKEFGPMATNVRHEKGIVYLPRKTANGVSYVVSRGKSGFFLTMPMRSNIQGVSLPTTQPVTKWNAEPYVSVMAWFLPLGKRKSCAIDIEFSLPATVDRPHLDPKKI